MGTDELRNYGYFFFKRRDCVVPVVTIENGFPTSSVLICAPICAHLR